MLPKNQTTMRPSIKYACFALMGFFFIGSVLFNQPQYTEEQQIMLDAQEAHNRANSPDWVRFHDAGK